MKPHTSSTLHLLMSSTGFAVAESSPSMKRPPTEPESAAVGENCVNINTGYKVAIKTEDFFFVMQNVKTASLKMCCQHFSRMQVNQFFCSVTFSHHEFEKKTFNLRNK